ncbi:MAG: threonylcarbamoyl-AMP synthase [Candidatus Wallbacteria bacterium]|nr:threonylcarbamoyl-AMP synthase [Candidatus Wallbacteria bacterium]
MADLLRMPASEAGKPGYEVSLGQLRRALLAGGLVAFPTDTVWGIAALAARPYAILRIFELKEREARKALPVFELDTPSVKRWVQEWPAVYERLAAAYWPGPLTLVCRPRAGELSAVVAEDGTVAFRVPRVPLLADLLRVLGKPIVCTSANRSGQPPLPSAAEVLEVFGKGLLYVVETDQATDAADQPSTLVGLRQGRAVVLREGTISNQEIDRVALLDLQEPVH